MRTTHFSAAIVLSLSIVTLAAKPVSAGDAARPPETRPSVADLMLQRVASAKEGMRLAEQLYSSGQVTSGEVAAWTQRWLESSLEAAGSMTQRITVLEQFLALAKAREADADNRFRAGITSHLDVESAHYSRLDAELRLARLQARAEGTGAADKHARSDKQLLQGTWKVVKKVKKGETEDPKADPGSLKFSGETVTLYEGDEKKGAGTFKIDESSAPRRITLTGTSGQNAGTTFEAIYALDGDTLKLAYSIGDKAGTPPADFTGGKGEAMEVLERQGP